MNKPLTDDLLGLVPQRPDPSSWGPRVRRAKTRRRALGGIAMTVAVLGTAVALSNTLGTHGPLIATPGPSQTNLAPASTEQPTPSPSPTTIPPNQKFTSEELLAQQNGLIPEACAALTDSPEAFSPPPADGLPTGADRVWLCGDPASVTGDASWIGPQEALTTDPDRVARVYNTLPGTDAHLGCDGDAGLGYRVVVDYPDQRIAFDGTVANCQTVGDRRGGEEFMNDLTALWDAQRTAAPPTFTSTEGICNFADIARLNFVTMDINFLGWGNRSFFHRVPRETLTRGVLCGVDFDDTIPSVLGVSEVWLPDRILTELRTAELAAPPEERTDEPILEAYLVLLNEAGDPVTYRISRDGGVLINANKPWDWVGTWYPSSDVADQWSATLEAAGIVPE